MPPWKALGQKEQWWLRLMFDVRVVKDELLVGKRSKVAKRLEIGPSE